MNERGYTPESVSQAQVDRQIYNNLLACPPELRHAIKTVYQSKRASQQN